MHICALRFAAFEVHEADCVAAVYLEGGVAYEAGDPEFLRVDICADETVAGWCPDHGLEFRAHTVLLSVAGCEPCVLYCPSCNGAHGDDPW